MKAAVAELSRRGVFIGTSSWKYEGWLGQLYTPAKYLKQAKQAKAPEPDLFSGIPAETKPAKPVKVSKELFEDNCLSEYAEVFKTVSVDAAYYRFPSVEYLQGLADQVPDDFRFGFKVTDATTIKNYPNLPKHGANAGRPNASFLNPELFRIAFLKPCEAIRQKVGLLIFEFSHFTQKEYPDVRDFVAELDKFLTALPPDWPYGIELRNRKWLGPEYFGCLAKHKITHVFNSWTDMPPVTEQMEMAGSQTNPECIGARFLLKPGRTTIKQSRCSVLITKRWRSMKPPTLPCLAWSWVICDMTSAGRFSSTLIIG